MPVPSIAEWEWVNWKFPRPVKAGETIYARWTLTQKRPPVGGAPTAIVVWRVDVHTADGALCAEGEVGASVRRKAQGARPRAAEGTAAAPVPTSSSAPASRRRRGRRPAVTAKPAETVVAAPADPTPKPVAEKTGPARRRRRRRPRSGTSSGQNGQPAAPVPAAEAPPLPSAPAPVVAAALGPVPAAGRLSRVIKRLRRP
jgi:hypothetical protein